METSKKLRRFYNLKPSQYKFSTRGVRQHSDTGNNMATVTVTQSLRQYLRNVPEKHEIKLSQKLTATLCTPHRLQEVPM
jgi:hypothetical protein